MAIPIFFLITDLDLGGAPLLLRSLALGLRAQGDFAPTLVSLAPPGQVSQMLLADGLPVLSLNLTSPRQLPLALCRWITLLKTHRPKIIMSVLIHANVLATLARPFAPLAVYFQSIHTLQKDPAWHWTLQGLIANQCHAIVVPDRSILQKIAQHGYFSSGLTIPNGIDIDRFHLAPPAGISPPWPPSARIVGYVGRFDPVKRLPLLLHAAAYAIRHNLPISKDLHLALVGYGPQESELKALAAQLHLTDRVHFPGPTASPENWYKSFDLMCLPSDAEGFGLTVIEALAADRPVIAADIPPLRTIAHPALTLLSDFTPASLALAIQQVMNSPPLSNASWARALADLRSRYSLETMIAAYHKMFKDFSRS